ncbi:MAG: RNA polymerase sigma factor (sigma-70 family) [Planctomycetota bacterium]|jgi:RNA polymerase sigma factor (sigma-70 family)
MSEMNSETARLLQEASHGGAVAVDSLLTRYLPELHVFIRLRAGSRLLRKEHSEDLVQAVCREVLQDAGTFEYRGERSFKKWLCLTAQHKLYDRARFYGSENRDARRERPMATEPGYYSGYAAFLSASHRAIQVEEVQRLERIFDELPEQYAEVITLAKIVGLGHEEIASEMGKTVTGSRMLLHRALARLAVMLSERGDGSGSTDS